MGAFYIEGPMLKGATASSVPGSAAYVRITKATHALNLDERRKRTRCKRITYY